MSQGYQTSLGIDSANPVTKGFEFDNCTLGKTGEIIDSSGMRGTRSHFAARTREGNQTIQGTIELTPSPEELALLLPWILGANASGTTYALADTLPSRFVTVDKGAKVKTYAGCVVNKATFSGSSGMPIKLSLDVVGKTETVANAGTFPAVTYQNTAPFMFAGSTLTLLSTARNVRDFTLVVDNMLEVQFYNSATASSITPKDRQVSFSCNVPYTSSETDLYDQALAGSAATYALTYSNYSMTFSFATLQFPSISPPVPSRQELVLSLNGVARKVGSTNELIVTLDSTP